MVHGPRISLVARKTSMPAKARAVPSRPIVKQAKTSYQTAAPSQKQCLAQLEKRKIPAEVDILKLITPQCQEPAKPEGQISKGHTTTSGLQSVNSVVDSVADKLNNAVDASHQEVNFTSVKGTPMTLKISSSDQDALLNITKNSNPDKNLKLHLDPPKAEGEAIWSQKGTYKNFNKQNLQVLSPQELKIARTLDSVTKTLDKIGKIAKPISIVTDTITIATAEDKPKAVAELAGESAGGWAGASAAATTCATWAAPSGPLGIAGAGLGCGAVGGIVSSHIGKKFGGWIYDSVKNAIGGPEQAAQRAAGPRPREDKLDLGNVWTRA